MSRFLIKFKTTTEDHSWSGRLPTWHPQEKKSGFTLIELLVVIAVLAALLVPTLAKANAKAKQAACINNLRHTGIAVTMYVGDNNDLYPNCLKSKPNGFDVWQPRVLTIPL